MKTWNIAVIGATGLVGNALLSLMEETEFPVNNLIPIGSDNSCGETIRFKGSSIRVQSLANSDLDNIDLAFLITRAAAALERAIDLAKTGVILIDCSGFFANSNDVPLVIPGINDGDAKLYHEKNMIALPSPVVIQALKTALVVTDADNILRLDVTSYLPASYYGKDKIDALAGQTARLLNGLGIEGHQIAFNLEPAKGTILNDDALLLQCRRILNNDQLQAVWNTTNVPVFYGLAQNVNVTSDYPVDITQWEEGQEIAFDIVQVNNRDPLSLLGIADVAPELFVGDIHTSPGMTDMVQVWSRSDNVRYLGASMALRLAVQILQSDF